MGMLRKMPGTVVNTIRGRTGTSHGAFRGATSPLSHVLTHVGATVLKSRGHLGHSARKQIVQSHLGDEDFPLSHSHPQTL